MQLTKNFSLAEMIFSETALKEGIPNTPNHEQIKNLQYLCEAVLQPLRQSLGRAININSGFRSFELNQAVDGVRGSHHLCLHNTAAADIILPGVQGGGIEILYNKIQELNLPFEELIHEGRWVHVSAIRPARHAWRK